MEHWLLYGADGESTEVFVLLEADFYARQTNVAVKAYHDIMRNGINVILKFMDGAPLGGGGRKLATFCRLAGKDKKMGRGGIFIRSFRF